MSKKIDDQELKELQASFKITDVLGYLYKKESDKLNEIKESIYEKYGKVKVDIQSGEIEIIENNPETENQII